MIGTKPMWLIRALLLLVAVVAAAPDADAFGRGRGRGKVDAAGGKTTTTPALVISNATVAENAAVGALVGNLSVQNGAGGTYTFTITADPDSKFAIDGVGLETGAALDYETATSHSVTVEANNGAGSIVSRTFTVTVTDVDDTAPTVTSSNSGSVAEGVVLAHALTANEAVTWTITGGADQARFEINGSTLRWASNGVKDFEAPDDAGTNNGYVVQVTATDAATNATNQTVTITVTDVDDTAPTITSSATPSVSENSTLGHALTANETVSWTITGGVDAAHFELSGSTLRWLANGTKDFEAPTDTGSNNGYVVQVTATDSFANATNQSITVTVTDVDEGGGAFVASLDFSDERNSQYLGAM